MSKQQKSASVQQGTVKAFKPDKGYGFIKQDSGEADLFVHISKIVGRKIQDGDEVEYEIAPGRDLRLQAVNVRRVEA